MPEPQLHQATPAELKARLEAERRGKPFLVYSDDAGRQQIVELDAARGRLVVGRGPRADVRLDWDTDVSRVHAELEHLGGAWTVADDGLSRNGTFLDSDRLRGRRCLAEHDRPRFGTTNVVFRAPAGEQKTTTQGTSLRTDAAEIALSPAQRRVLVALARPVLTEGSFATPATNKQIAEELYLSVDAVKTHLRTLTMKFGIQDLPQNRKRARLVELALQNGEISERDIEPDS